MPSKNPALYALLYLEGFWHHFAFMQRIFFFTVFSPRTKKKILGLLCLGMLLLYQKRK